MNSFCAQEYIWFEVKNLVIISHKTDIFLDQACKKIRSRETRYCSRIFFSRAQTNRLSVQQYLFLLKLKEQKITNDINFYLQQQPSVDGGMEYSNYDQQQQYGKASQYQQQNYQQPYQQQPQSYQQYQQPNQPMNVSQTINYGSTTASHTNPFNVAPPTANPFTGEMSSNFVQPATTDDYSHDVVQQQNQQWQ